MQPRFEPTTRPRPSARQPGTASRWSERDSSTKSTDAGMHGCGWRRDVPTEGSCSSTRLKSKEFMVIYALPLTSHDAVQNHRPSLFRFVFRVRANRGLKCGQGGDWRAQV